jgi:CspA family cold shock protein
MVAFADQSLADGPIRWDCLTFAIRHPIYGLSIFCLLNFGCRAICTVPDELPFQNTSLSPPAGPLVLRIIVNALKGFIMTTGTVKWFNSTKGFGFIQPDNGGEDAFVHISAVERAGMREIVEGQKLSYELERDKKSGKMSACNLQAA